MVKNLDLLDADELINNLYSKFKNDEEILKKASSNKNQILDLLNSLII